MEESNKLLIFGSGTLAEIAFFYFQTDTSYEVLGFVDLPEFTLNRSNLLGKPIWSLEDVKKNFSLDDVQFFIAVGYRKTNEIRQRRFEELKNLGYKLASYISSRATVFTTEIGENCFILENNVIQPYTVIGNNVVMWSGNHIGHHSVIENHVFIASHAVISGKCTVKENSFLGVNCCLHDGITIGKKSVIGAGAIVTESCEPRSVFKPSKTDCRIISRDII
jgi:sugar O-acyltransferase (sialic acid O-acetyltransferase NeuD family)